MKKLKTLLASAVALLVLAGCGAISPYAAKVNGERISERQLHRELDAIRENRAYVTQIEQQLGAQGAQVRGTGKGTLDSAFVARVLTRQILLELVHAEVVRRGIRVGREELDAARRDLGESFGDPKVFRAFPAAYREDLVRRAAEVNALQRALTSDVDEAAVREYYEQNQGQFTETCTRHILTGGFQPGQPGAPEQVDAARQQAEQIRGRIAAGEDFAEVARGESKDPGSGQQGGDLGCQPKGTFVPEFERAQDALQPGQVSDPVQSPFGFHIIQVLSRRTAPLEEAAPMIRQRLQGQSANAISEFLQNAVARATIVVSPRYGRFQKSGPQAGVVPPDAPTTTEAPVPGAQLPER